MSIMNIFTQDAFSVMRLTDALREISYVPSLIGQMNLFQTVSIDTLDIAIEKDKAQNGILIQASPRGGPGQTFGKGKRSMRTLRIPHFQVDDAINADEVQQVRAFGEEVAVERLQAKIAERAAEALGGLHLLRRLILVVLLLRVVLLFLRRLTGRAHPPAAVGGRPR